MTDRNPDAVLILHKRELCDPCGAPAPDNEGWSFSSGSLMTRPFQRMALSSISSGSAAGPPIQRPLGIHSSFVRWYCPVHIVGSRWFSTLGDPARNITNPKLSVFQYASGVVVDGVNSAGNVESPSISTLAPFACISRMSKGSRSLDSTLSS